MCLHGSDYANDLKSVLDQSLRVLNAMVDIAADGGHLEVGVLGGDGRDICLYCDGGWYCVMVWCSSEWMLTNSDSKRYLLRGYFVNVYILYYNPLTLAPFNQDRYHIAPCMHVCRCVYE